MPLFLLDDNDNTYKFYTTYTSSAFWRADACNSVVGCSWWNYHKWSYIMTQVYNSSSLCWCFFCVVEPQTRAINNTWTYISIKVPIMCLAICYYKSDREKQLAYYYLLPCVAMFASVPLYRIDGKVYGVLIIETYI